MINHIYDADDCLKDRFSFLHTEVTSNLQQVMVKSKRVYLTETIPKYVYGKHTTQKTQKL